MLFAVPRASSPAFRPAAFALVATGLILGWCSSGCTFHATQNYGADGTPSSSSVGGGLNIGIPGLQGLGGGGGGGPGGGGGGGGPGGGGPF